MIRIDQIRTDGGTQSRAAINDETVTEYAEAMADPNAVFPPCIVYHDGRDYWLADGFHRVEAWRRIGRVEVPAEIRQGDRRKAVLHSCGANAAHGLRRTNADKRRAVMTLLEDEEWSAWSDRQIARQCGVSQPLVSKLRKGESDNGYHSEAVIEAQRRADNLVPTPTAGSSRDDEPSPVRKPSQTWEADNAGISVADVAADGPAPISEPEDGAIEESPQPVAAPDPHRNGLSQLSRDGLENECAGLRAENADLRDRVAKQRVAIADLNAQVKELSSDNKGAVISGLQKQLGAAKLSRDEAMRKAARFERLMKEAQKRAVDLEKVEIPYG